MRGRGERDALSGLPPGIAALWMSLRRGDDVRSRALAALQALPHVRDAARGQFARDVAFAFARSAQQHEPDLTAAFARRRGDLAVVVRAVGDHLDRVLRDDSRRRLLNADRLMDAARTRLREMARVELGRSSPGRR